MQYSRIYDNLIQKRINIPVSEKEYSEKHHIIPKSMGGGNGENIVRLTAREHFLAHWLLAKIHGKDMWAAFAFMCKRARQEGEFVPSVVYERARKAHAEKISEKKGSKHHNYGKVVDEKQRQKLSLSLSGEKNYWFGKKLTEEHKAKLSKAAVGRKMHPNTKARLSAINKTRIRSDQERKNISEGLKGHVTSQETRQKISGSLKGRKLTQCQKEKLRQANIGRKPSPETLKKMSESQKGKKLSEEHLKNVRAAAEKRKGTKGTPHTEEFKKKISKTFGEQVECPFCGKIGRLGPMKRWHFDNCKHAFEKAGIE